MCLKTEKAMMLPYLVIFLLLLSLPTAMSSLGIRIVFSDLDGTLIHYDRNESSQNDGGREKAVVSLPASSTGMIGTISRETYSLCRNIRSQGCKLIFVSGTRFSTLLTRLPYLPRGDFYVCDNGGRIFQANADVGSKYVVPKDPLDEPFYLKEDMEWRRRIEAIVGADGYVELDAASSDSSILVPMKERTGVLWEYVKRLQQKGIVVDSKSYSTCFRINRKHNSGELFDTLQANGLKGLDESLTTSVNLGCIDVVPKMSGKKNWYVQQWVCCLALNNTTLVANTWQNASLHLRQRCCSRTIVSACATMTTTSKWLLRATTPSCLA